MMKKIVIIGLCLLLLGVSIVVATPGMRQQTTQTVPFDPTGTFDGVISHQRGPNATIVGTISGNYTLRSRVGRFTGDWATENRTGTLRGGFGRHYLIGRISTIVNGTVRSLPIVGFIRAQNNSFIGRFMAPVGPALYFWGDYT
jgi:hypothetical protein